MPPVTADPQIKQTESTPTVLITGAAKRLGQATARAFFERGCNMVIHYNHSLQQAQLLQQEFNQQRSNSCLLINADLSSSSGITPMLAQINRHFGRLDHLVNNASVFYPNDSIVSCETNVATAQLSEILQINYRAPHQLARLAVPMLAQHKGSITNLLDIYASSGLAKHSFYVAAKAALKAVTQQLAQDLAPDIRVNGVSPGAIMWPDPQTESSLTQTVVAEDSKNRILQATSLKYLGDPRNIAATIVYLALDAHYTTGSEIRVDGGRRDYI